MKPGDHVIACLSVFCGYCDDCMSGHPNRCTNRAATQRRKGDTPRLSLKGQPMKQFADLSTYAEKMLVHENALVKIGNDMPLDRAALIGCGVTTGVGAVLNTARIEPGSTVAVFGCGGVGLAAIQGARIAGARMIIAVDQFESKLALARRLGATHTVDASHTDAVKAIRELASPGQPSEPVVAGLGVSGGVDYSFEAVGLKKLAEECFDCIKPGGTATIIGMIPVGQKVELDGPKFLTERKIQGTNMGSNRFRIDMLALHRFLPAGPPQPRRHDHPARQAPRRQRGLPCDESRRGRPHRFDVRLNAGRRENRPIDRRDEMKAAIFHGPGKPLSIEEIHIDEPREHEVLVRTVATGVCHSDLHFVEGL